MSAATPTEVRDEIYAVFAALGYPKFDGDPANLPGVRVFVGEALETNPVTQSYLQTIRMFESVLYIALAEGLTTEDQKDAALEAAEPYLRPIPLHFWQHHKTLGGLVLMCRPMTDGGPQLADFHSKTYSAALFKLPVAME